MRITKLHIQNIGVFENETIEFPEKKEPDKAEIHIFTGENGTGKSTVLETLASFSLIPQKGNNNNPTSFTTNRLYDRMHKDKTVINWEIFFNNGQYTNFSYSWITGLSSKGKFEKLQRLFEDINYMPFKDAKFDTLFVCYSGNRYTEKVTPNLEDETFYLLKNHPYKNCLEFAKSIDAQRFVNWIAKLKMQEALAYQKNDQKKVEAYRKNIRIIEKLISEVIGKAVEFELEYEPFELLVKMDNQSRPLDVLPDGLKSIVSWIGDLLMRMDLIPWVDDTPILEREFILFLDEIEVHLHPAWQRKILPVVQRMFPNAQIFISTHSPFVVGSVDNAWVHKLVLENGNAKVQSTTLSSASKSYELVLNEIFDIKEEFGEEVEQEFRTFYALRDKMQAKDLSKKADFEAITRSLLERQSIEIESIIGRELRQLERQVGYKFPQLA